MEGPSAYVLTLLAHPDSTRVGEIAWLMDVGRPGCVDVGRLAPLFRDSRPGAGGGAALSVSWISRSGVRIESLGGTRRVTVDSGATNMEVSCDGRPLGGARELSVEELKRGVVLELARSVALMLHIRHLDPATSRNELGLLGRSEKLEAVRREILKVADLDVPVLLRGESGVGKELVASAIHRESTRRAKSYACVNMAALPPSVAASELFGHARGAFTGAGTAHDGYFVRADGGTLFLDEIGELPSEVQPLLLRALETGEIQTVGASRTRKVDVRFVSATDADLERAVQEGRFRLPLWQRLCGFELAIPPLRERRDDIARLFVHFLREELAQSGQGERLDPPATGARPWLSARFVAELVRYSWPGNVRQLRNVARQVAIGNRGEARFHVPPMVERMLHTHDREPGVPNALTAPGAPDTLPPIPPARPGDLDDGTIAEHWRVAGYKLDEAAESLGVSRSWLHTRLERCAGVRKATELAAEEIAACWAEVGGDLERAASKLEVSPRALQLQRKRLRIS